MEVYTAAGCWPGQGAGRIVWVEPAVQWDRTPVTDRAAELIRLRQAISQGLADLDGWMEKQQTLEGRILLQRCRESLQDPAFTQRLTNLIDQHAVPAPAALVEAAGLVAGIMARSEELKERAESLPLVARWLAGRLAGLSYPPDAVLAARAFSVLELLDRTQPAIMAAGEPGVMGEAPLLWGIEAAAPEWAGRRAIFQGNRLEIGLEEEAQPLPYEAERRLVLQTARRMKADKLVRLTAGNVSCRIAGRTLFAITPSGMEYDELEPADICILDLEGNLVDGRRRPSSEAPLHRLVYRSRPDVGGVVHTHSLYASAFACTGQPLPVISIELAGLVGGAVPCAPYAPSGTAAFAEAAVATLGEEGVAVLFQNHGVMAVGPSLAQAYAVALGLEEAAQLYCIARQVGEPIILPEAECRRIFEVMHTRYGQSGEA